MSFWRRSLLHGAPDFWKRIALFEGSQDLPAYTFDNNSLKMNMNTEHWLNHTSKGETIGRPKIVQVTFCQPKKPNRAEAAVRGMRLTAWAMPRPILSKNFKQKIFKTWIPNLQ
jgi:hypothetical protein